MNPKGLLPPPAPNGVGAPQRGAAGGLSLGPLENAALRPPDAGPSEPPNLATATEEGMRCGTCTHFGDNGCQKFQYPVADNQVCDAWESPALDPAAMENPEPMPAMAGGGGLPPGMEG